MAPKNIEKLEKKAEYLNKFKNLIDTVPQILIVHADNVGSKQFQEIRIALRGRATIVMGKNTMIRTALRMYQEENPEKDVSKILEIVRGNIGFVFCHGDMEAIRTEIASNKVPASARTGIVAQTDVFVPAGPTGLDPSQTNFFQALNIATKIVKGTVEIISDVHLIKKGNKVQASEQALLQKLNIKPFAFGLEIQYICDEGSVFPSAVLDITDDVIVSKFVAGIANVAAFSREVGIPTEASLPHAIVSAFKNMAALCSDIDYCFKEIEQIKEFLKDPSKFASAAPAAAAGGAAVAAAPAAAAPVEEEEEEDDGMGFDLFD